MGAASLVIALAVATLTAQWTLSTSNHVRAARHLDRSAMLQDLDREVDARPGRVHR
jgi:hypothetical protein